MFRGKTYCLLLLFAAGAMYSVWIFRSPTQRDYRAYQKLMRYSDAVKQLPKDQALASQQRSQVQKQLIFTEGDQRLQWRLESAESEVLLDQKGNTVEFIEHLRQVECRMQEKAPSEANFQFLRCLAAAEANFRYKTKQLTAANVTMDRYKIDVRNWIDDLASFKPFMKGEAQSIDMTFSHPPSFKAHGFQAIFRDWE